MSLKNKAIKGVFWSALESWGHQIISSIVFFVLARLLGPESFGLIALASVYIAFIGIFSGSSLSSAIVQRADLEPEHLDTAFWTSLLISIALTLVSFTLAGWIAILFSEPTLKSIVRWLSISLLINAFSDVQQAIFQRNMDFRALSIRSLVATTVSGIVGVTMALTGSGVWSLVGQQLSSSLTKVLVLWWVSTWRPRLKFSKSHFKELLSFSINVTGSSFTNFFSRRSDDLLIGYFLGATALGYYSVAYKLLLMMIDLFSRVLEKVAMPIFSKLQNEPTRIREAFYQVTQTASLITFPAFIGAGILAPELILIFFGNQWGESIPIMQILVFIGILQSLSIFNSTVLLAMGKPDWRFALGLFLSITNVICFAISVHWGIKAVALAYVIKGYLLSPISLSLIKKLIKISYLKYVSQLYAPAVCTLIMTLGIVVTKYTFADQINSIWLLLCCVSIGTIMYSSSLFLIFPSKFKKTISYFYST
ncbi:MAG: lipopolysaccharide biosynthesis protein [Tildeniella torsiva UHER 1998/13D]|jgi:PST family polysaccharide transporter|nr:lipopolysaccharide biosynthesis protein [Tildeniella torsiva UHER 1998/13D]